VAERALAKAKGNSVGKAIDWAKAATLIAAAGTQKQFEEYQNWVIKAKQARKIIARRN
jgi:Cu/Ag efflux pump CusA